MKRLISTLLLVESVAFKQRCPGATSSSLPPGAAAARWCGGASLAPIFASTWKAPSPSRSLGRRFFSGRHEDLPKVLRRLAAVHGTPNPLFALSARRAPTPPARSRPRTRLAARLHRSHLPARLALRLLSAGLLRRCREASPGRSTAHRSRGAAGRARRSGATALRSDPPAGACRREAIFVSREARGAWHALWIGHHACQYVKCKYSAM